jgi:hypothetical protein
LVERERGERKGENSFTPHPCTQAPEWNSLCWLGDSEREEKERRKVALSETDK